MAHSVCPWWLGYLHIIPLRRLWQHPSTILSPFATEGMLVLEPGCGMGYFTLDLARIVGPRGKVVAVDLQPRMIAGLSRRARRSGLAGRIVARLAGAGSLAVEDLAGRVDFVLAFAVIHEFPDARAALGEMHRTLKPGGKILVAEPRGHVSADEFAALKAAAIHEGFQWNAGPSIRSSWTAVLTRT